MTATDSIRLQPDATRHTWGHFIEDVAARHGDGVIRVELFGVEETMGSVFQC